MKLFYGFSQSRKNTFVAVVKRIILDGGDFCVAKIQPQAEGAVLS